MPITRARLTDRLLYTLAAFAILSLSAALLVVLHGFSGGHGRHDLAITLLGLPGSILLPLIPEILLVHHSDLFNVVAIPWLINSVLVLTVYLAVRPFAANPHNPTR